MVGEAPLERANVNHDILKHELLILEALAGGMSDYLVSDVAYWDLRRPGIPPLTISGYLLRQRRLAALAGQLDADERLVLERARQTFDAALRERVVRFEERAYQELVTRLREWTTYMRDLSRSARLMANREHYAGKVVTRLSIGELVSKLSERPYRLDGRVPRDVAALDGRLRQMWQPGEFVLADIWRPVYPSEPYWWLYGQPKAA